MKIKIGPYRDRLICRIYSSHMNKKYGIVDWPNEQDYEDHVLEAIDEGVQSVYNVFNWLWFDRRTGQKQKIHIDPWDTWSMDHTLAPIILPMLKQLKATKHGAPMVDDKDVPKHLHMTKKEQTAFNKDGSTTDKFFQRWDWIMDEMIYAFDCKANKDDVYMRFDDRDEMQKEQERISNGFRLFGKYYENLWD